MNKKLYYALLLFVSIALVNTSCSKDDDKAEDPVIPNEEEVITTLVYTLTPVGGGETVELRYADSDGDGPNAPVITTEDLKSNTVYSGKLELLNEASSPTEDITEEIEEEDEEHQFFFEVSDALNVVIAYGDNDANNFPVGLTTSVSAGEAGQGDIKVTLRHEPDKAADGVSAGAIDNAGGETDIEVTFSLSVVD